MPLLTHGSEWQLAEYDAVAEQDLRQIALSQASIEPALVDWQRHVIRDLDKAIRRTTIGEQDEREAVWVATRAPRSVGDKSRSSASERAVRSSVASKRLPPPLARGEQSSGWTGAGRRRCCAHV